MIKYTLDFKVVYADDTIEYIDIKGWSAEKSRMKLKMLQYLHQDKIFKWIAFNAKYGDEFGWIDWFELQKIQRRNKKNK